MPLSIGVGRRSHAALAVASIHSLGRPVAGLFVFLTLVNLAVWVWAVLAFRGTPVLLGTALLAYGLGLRHAVDADHIAAIDNVTRKLMQQGERPVGIGLFFAMGHSTVVILAAAAVTASAIALAGSFDRIAAVGSVIGTGVSALFLFAIAATNLFILLGIWRSLQRARRGTRGTAADIEDLLAGRGLIARLFRPLFGMVHKSWHMYPLGLLFGLGFDTATEVAVLAVSATAAVKGVSVSAIVFPALFAAGMALIDSTDGVLMLGAYGWAFADPNRKLYYNLTITFVSVVIALLTGGVEALSLMTDCLALKGGLRDGIAMLNDNFTVLGIGTIGVFITAWVGSTVVYRCTRIAEIRMEESS